jgi:hypothetical protein
MLRYLSVKSQQMAYLPKHPLMYSGARQEIYGAPNGLQIAPNALFANLAHILIHLVTPFGTALVSFFLLAGQMRL